MARHRTLVIGWDAADWRFIQPLIDRGLMPTLASLRGRSCFGNLSTLQPALSPMLWTTIATGKRPREHGVLGFVEPTPDGSGVRPVGSGTRQCESLWTIAHAAGLRTNVVGWYATHPAESINGCIISNQFELPFTDAANWPVPQGSVHPPELAEVLAPLRLHPTEVSGDALLPFVPSLAGEQNVVDPLLNKLRQLVAQTASIHAIATHLIEHTTWDLQCVYYEGIDRFGHEFMQFHPPRMTGVTDEQFERYQHVMTGCYRWHDMMLDRLLQLAGDDTNILLLSDHGYFHDARRPRIEADPQSWHRSHGIAVLAGPGVRAGEKLFGATLLDVAPTVLALLDLPAGQDMPGRVWTEALRASPPPRRDTWEDASAAVAEKHESREDPAVVLASLKQLADLGYVDESAIAGPQAAARAASLQQYNLAISLLDEQRPADAVAILSSLAAEHPDDFALSCQFAVAHAVAGDLATAKSLASRLAERAPDHPRVQLLLGSLALSAGDADTAEHHLLAVAQSANAHPDLHCRLGQIYLTAQRYDAAAAAFDRCLSLDPDHAVALDGASEAALGRGAYQQAADFALAAVASAHHLPRAHYHLAAALDKLGQKSEAITAARVCIHLAPTHRAARLLLARLLDESGQNEEALQHRLAAQSLRES